MRWPGPVGVPYRTGVTLHTGLRASITATVTDADTADALRSGNVPVLATSRLVALCEEASCQAVAGQLPSRATSVGKRVQFDHLVPVAVGRDVVVEAMLDRIQGRRLTFTVSVTDGAGLVGAGKVARVVVDEAEFLGNVR